MVANGTYQNSLTPQTLGDTCDDDIEITIKDEPLNDNEPDRKESNISETRNEDLTRLDDGKPKKVAKALRHRTILDDSSEKEEDMPLAQLGKRLKITEKKRKKRESLLPFYDQSARKYRLKTEDGVILSEDEEDLMTRLFRLRKQEWADQQRVLCDICGNIFASSNILSLHKRIHIGYKPYPCSYCSKSFSRKEQAKEHERVHTGERPFVCDYCSKGFTQRSPLRIHKRIHTGERPYKCRLCARGFISKGVMDTHTKSCMG